MSEVVDGQCAAGFADVAAEFARNFGERDEIGASVCVMHQGQTVVDLWGGSADPHRDTRWQRDTLVVVFSCTKAATALCAHSLASRGELDLDARVGFYWPGFDRRAKSDISVRMLLNHQAGLPGLREAVSLEALCDFDMMVSLMENETPLWRPGSRHGYHALTFGWLLGEVIRRICGEPVGAYFRRTIAQPLGADFWIGLPSTELHRVATTVRSDGGPAAFGPRFAEALASREPIQETAYHSLAPLLAGGACNEAQFLAAEIPAANGVTNARGLARMYAPLSLGGSLDGVELVDANQLVQMTAVESAGEDAVTFDRCRFSAGFEKAASGRTALEDGDGLVLSEAAFGHSGLGGAVGFADPAGRFSFGYAMNRHARSGERQSARCQPLIDATYRALGFGSNAGGKWV
jgi:CubicO group peptidase (beta-lactamase class C family)